MKNIFLILVSISLLPILSLGQDSIPPEIKLLKKYVQYPSEQYKEKDAGLFFMKECERRGLHTRILHDNDSSFNFIASLYPLSAGKPNIIFLNHIDVVPPGDSASWTYPPYSGIIKDRVLWGRGSIDNKGMAVAQLFATSQFIELAKENDLPYNVTILSVCGEETDGHNGAMLVVEEFLKELNPFFVLGEGGSGVKNIIKSKPDKIVFGISTVEKTKIILALSIDIPSSGHGSVPPKEYALKETIFALEKVLKEKPKIEYNRTSVRALKTLGKHETGIAGFVQKHFTFLIFRPLVKREIKKDPIVLSFFSNTITLTKLVIPEGTENMITNKATAIFDCRLLPGEDPQRFIRRINRLVKDDRVQCKIVSEVISGPQTKNNEMFRHMSNAIDSIYKGAIVVDMIFPATTDNNFFRDKGIPVFGVFPACFDNEELMSIHSSNEKIHFERVRSAIEIYRLFLSNYLKPRTSAASSK